MYGGEILFKQAMFLHKAIHKYDSIYPCDEEYFGLLNSE